MATVEGKNKYIVVVTTKWGAAHGGINAFNTDFCKILGGMVAEPYKVVCALEDFSEEEEKEANETGVELVEIGPLSNNSHSTIIGHEFFEQENCSFENIEFWIGHDSISGHIANNGKKRTSGKSIIFQHMAYEHYVALKYLDGDRAKEKVDLQKNNAEVCDYIFGVGPLLTDYAKELLNTDEERKKVDEFVPGLKTVDKKEPYSKSFTGIVMGRLNAHDDSIKKSRLAFQAFCNFVI